MTNPEPWQVFAIRYAEISEQQRQDNFIKTPDPHDGPMPMDFFVWALVKGDQTIVIDTGFDDEEGKKRNRKTLRRPKDGLSLIGVDTDKVEDVIITHLHYDHAGTSQDFPNARFHLQDLEMEYATGRHMCHAHLRHAYAVDHMVDFIRHLYNGRVVFHDKDCELAPGVSLHHIGGHTKGLQSVRVFTERGWVVLASDASHFYENMETASPFPIVHDLGDMLDGYVKLRSLADSDQHIIPGHDPLVMKRYPAPNKECEGIIVRLDVPPT